MSTTTTPTTKDIMSTQFSPNRIIKFRAWDKIELKMYHWNPNFFCDTSPVTSWSGIFPSEDDNIILMQFTGLLDKNGQEIFEGDIVLRHTFNNGDKDIELIVFKEEYSAFNFENEAGFTFCKDNCYKFKVVGNIFKNPRNFSGYQKFIGIERN